MTIYTPSGQNYNIDTPEEALDCLIFITQDIPNLVNIILYNSPESISLNQFNIKFKKETRDNYKYIYCFHFASLLKSYFINSDSKFVFEKYILKNETVSDFVKISKIKNLLYNINKIKNEVLTKIEKEPLSEIPISEINLLEKYFKEKFQTNILISYDFYGEIAKLTGESYYFLIYCISRELLYIAEKTQVTFSGYINTDTNIDILNYSPEVNEILKNRNEILDVLFKNNQQALKKYIKFEDKLIRYGFLNQDKTLWLKNSSTFIRFYIHCERNLLRKGVYENNTNGIQHFRNLYNFHSGKSIDSPSKRHKQLTKLTKNDFDFLDF